MKVRLRAGSTAMDEKGDNGRMDRPIINLRNSTMNKRITLAVAALAAAVTVTFSSSAFALFPVIPLPPLKINVPHHGHNNDLVCRARGDILFITNFGDKNADSGRTVTWAVSNGDAGELLLPKMLAPGEEVMIADALNELAAPGDDCQAAFA